MNPFSIFKKDSLGMSTGDWFKLWLRRDDVLSKLSSRKLWAAVAGAAIVALGTGLGIPDSATATIAALIGKYILGQAGVDIAKELIKIKQG